jgi:hypothetical protein
VSEYRRERKEKDHVTSSLEALQLMDKSLDGVLIADLDFQEEELAHQDERVNRPHHYVRAFLKAAITSLEDISDKSTITSWLQLIHEEEGNGTTLANTRWSESHIMRFRLGFQNSKK